MAEHPAPRSDNQPAPSNPQLSTSRQAERDPGAVLSAVRGCDAPGGADPLRNADHSAHGWQESLQIDRLKVEAGEAELLSQREGPKCFDTRPRLVIKLACPGLESRRDGIQSLNFQGMAGNTRLGRVATMAG